MPPRYEVALLDDLLQDRVDLVAPERSSSVEVRGLSTDRSVVCAICDAAL
jgi:hypothetical protein